MKSYFISVLDESGKQTHINVAHIKCFFAELHYGKEVTTIQFEQGTVKVKQSSAEIRELIRAAQI